MNGHARIWVFALGAIALGEFLLLRFVLRMGPELPTGPAVEDAFSLAYKAGLWSLNLAGMLSLLVLGVVIYGTIKQRSPRFFIAGAALALAAALVLGGWAHAIRGGSQAMLLAQTIGVPIAMFAVFAAAPLRALRRAWLLAFPAVYMLAGLHFAARTANAGGVVAWTLTLAEVAAVCAAISAPFALSARGNPFAPFTRARKFAIVAATGAALFYAAFAYFEPTIAKFFVLWDSGFASSVPWPAQAVAIWALIYAVVAALPRPVGVGLLLIALAGIRLEYTYFSLLALAGFALAALSESFVAHTSFAAPRQEEPSTQHLVTAY